MNETISEASGTQTEESNTISAGQEHPVVERIR